MHTHQPESVNAAFSIVPKILAELESIGIAYPSFTLYKDGSGSLNLGAEDTVTEERYNKAVDLIHSNRIRPCYKCFLGNSKEEHVHEVVIDFCGGLIEEAKRRNDKIQS
jgi:hypothetical protein